MDVDQFIDELTPEEKDYLLKRCLTIANEWAMISRRDEIPEGMSYEEALCLFAKRQLQKRIYPYQPSDLMRVGISLPWWNPHSEMLGGRTLEDFNQSRLLKMRIKQINQQWKDARG